VCHALTIVAWAGFQVSAVVTTSIVLQTTDKARAKYIKKWVEVADKCLQLNNISCALDIVSGIGSSPIFRLRKTWSVRVRVRVCVCVACVSCVSCVCVVCSPADCVIGRGCPSRS
jgi:hypothetical protein